MNTIVTARWTADDENRLAELTERRKRIYDEAAEALGKALRDFDGLALSPPENEELRAFLIENATRMRELLKPFDMTAHSMPTQSRGRAGSWEPPNSLPPRPTRFDVPRPDVVDTTN